MKVAKSCPQCGIEAAGRAQVDSFFGFRKLSGKVVPQSWCRECRGGSMSLVDDRPATGDRWQTPVEVFRERHAALQFTVDAAAEAKNALLPRHFQDGLRSSWAGERVWCNPPYSFIDPWVAKAVEAEVACFLLPARTDRPWFTQAWDRKLHRPMPGWTVDFPAGRIRFAGAGTDPNWASVILTWDAAAEVA